jgi:hypothetical protein
MGCNPVGSCGWLRKFEGSLSDQIKIRIQGREKSEARVRRAERSWPQSGTRKAGSKEVSGGETLHANSARRHEWAQMEVRRQETGDSKQWAVGSGTGHDRNEEGRKAGRNAGKGKWKKGSGSQQPEERRWRVEDGRWRHLRRRLFTRFDEAAPSRLRTRRYMPIAGFSIRVLAPGLPRLTDPRHLDVAGAAENAKGVEQPDDDTDHHHDVEDLFDLPVHRDVGVDQPEQDTDDDEGDDDRDE